MEVLLGKTKVNGTGKTNSIKTVIPLVVAENLHIEEGSELFVYLNNSKVCLENSKREESSFGVSTDVCLLGSKILKSQGNVLGFSFANILRDVLGLSLGDYMGYYFDDGKIFIKKYVEKD